MGREIKRKERSTPIFWGQEDGVFGTEEINDLCEKGFLRLDPNETLGIRNQIPDIQELIETGESFRGEGCVWDVDAKALRSNYGVHEYITPIKNIVRDKALVSRAEHALGSNVYVHQTQLNSKAAFLGKKFFWHQDYTYWMNMDGMPGFRAIGVMIFLSDVTILNAPVIVIPGSHHYVYEKSMVPSTGPNYSSNINDEEQYYNERGLTTPDEVRDLVTNVEPVPFLGKCGTVIFFDPNLVHASSDNISPFNRNVLIIYYNSVLNRLVKPTRSEIVASRKYAAIKAKT